MNPKDIRNLVESYQNVYAEQEVSEDMYSTVKAGLEKGSRALENSPAGGVLKMLVGPVGGNKGKRTPSAADQKKKIAANENADPRIAKNVGIVGPPQKAIDKIPFVRDIRIAAANSQKGTEDEMVGKNKGKVGKHTVFSNLQQTRLKDGSVTSPNTRYTDISPDKKESVELYNIVFNHLIEEGFASSEENAEKIISVMSDEWISSIVEAKVDKKLPEHERSGARLDRYDNPSGALALGGGQQRARREEHGERRGKKK